MRTGLLAKKIGMTTLFQDTGHKIPITVLQISKPVVYYARTENVDGYNALCIGFGEKKTKRVSKPQKIEMTKKQLTHFPKYMKEFRVNPDAMLRVGDELIVEHFVEGQRVDVTGITKGKGFAGGIKRHGFGGLRATHGVSVSHRSIGSTGNREEPGRVFKGKKMPGQMGSVRVTQQNLTIVKCDTSAGLIYIKGSIPGSTGTIVMVKDAIKGTKKEDLPLPARLLQVSEKPKATKSSEMSSKNDAHVDASISDNKIYETAKHTEDTSS